MATNEKNGFADGWPAWAKLAFTLAGTAMWVGMPMIAAWHLAARTIQAGGVADYQPILVVLVGMTTATITGTFMFMTFRIDRSTKEKAGSVAKKAAKKSLKKQKKAAKSAISAMHIALKNTVDSSKQTIDDAVRIRLDEQLTPEKILENINARITDDDLRRHIETVLMIDANGQIMTEYLKERAKRLPPESIQQIIQLMEDIIQFLSSTKDDPEERGGDGGWLNRLRERFTR